MADYSQKSVNQQLAATLATAQAVKTVYQAAAAQAYAERAGAITSGPGAVIVGTQDVIAP